MDFFPLPRSSLFFPLGGPIFARLRAHLTQLASGCELRIAVPKQLLHDVLRHCIRVLARDVEKPPMSFDVLEDTSLDIETPFVVGSVLDAAALALELGL